MENQENETSMASQKKLSMNKTQNTFLSTGSSNKFKVNTLYRITSPNNTKYLPPIQYPKKISNKSMNKRKTNLKYDLYQTNYESNSLKQRLSDSKSNMNNKINDLIDLKAKNYKLSEENKNIKILIAQILNVDVTQAFSKSEIIEKIKNCVPTDEQKKKLEYVLDFIKLKIEIGSKKERINEINKQIEYYIKNAKIKILTDLENEFLLKTVHQNQIISTIEKLKEEVKFNTNKFEELRNIFLNKKSVYKKIKAEASELEKELNEVEEQRDKLDSLVINLRENQRKMQDRIKIRRYKNENNENLTDQKISLENIDDYIQNRDAKLEEIEQKKNSIKNLEKEIEELDKKINEINSKNEELTSKMDKYNKEGPKLIQQSYEPLSIQKNLQDLEEKLKIFK